MSLTEQGYHRPTYDEILEDKISLAKFLFGEDIETSEQTPLGKFIRIGAYDLAKAYEDLEYVYYARFPNTATGISLDRLCVFANLTRNPATYAEYTVTVYGTSGTQVDEIIVCGDNPEIVFHNLEPFTIGEDGTAQIIVECESIGEIGNGITINEIVNPIANIDGVGDSSQTEVGEEIESDYDLKHRIKLSMEGDGGSSVAAISAAVLQVTGVKSVSIIENATNETDADGRPPHSFECFVYGGDDSAQDIADKIFGIKPAGIQTVGDKSMQVTDASGREQTINFSYATTIRAHIRIGIKIDEEFPADGETQIQTNIADRINELDLGEPLILSRLYGCAYRVGGVPEVTSLEVSIDGGKTYSTSNVVVPEFNVIICSGVEVVI